MCILYSANSFPFSIEFLAVTIWRFHYSISISLTRNHFDAIRNIYARENDCKTSRFWDIETKIKCVYVFELRAHNIHATYYLFYKTIGACSLPFVHEYYTLQYANSEWAEKKSAKLQQKQYKRQNNTHNLTHTQTKICSVRKENQHLISAAALSEIVAICDVKIWCTFYKSAKTTEHIFFSSLGIQRKTYFYTFVFVFIFYFVLLFCVVHLTLSCECWLITIFSCDDVLSARNRQHYQVICARFVEIQLIIDICKHTHRQWER